MGETYCITHHSVRFSRASLAICKNAGVETFKGSFKDIQPQVLENLEQESIKKKMSFIVAQNSLTCKWKAIEKVVSKDTLSCEAYVAFPLLVESYE